MAFTPESIPTPDNAIITGDLNGHAPLWYLIQPTDKGGEDIVEWALDKELTILNDCSTTRVSRITGNESTPDVTLVGRKWDGKCTWEVCEQIGSSDHLPIKITVNSKITHQPILGKAARWKRNGVNWNDYSAAVEESVTTMPEEPNITKRILRFNQILKDAAMKHVGKSKPRKTLKISMTPTVRAALNKRNKLRKNVRQQRQEWLDACKEAQEEIRKARQESWEDLLESTLHENDERKMWNLVNSLKGCPESNSPNEASNKKKADLFVQHYANVSKHSFSKEEG